MRLAGMAESRIREFLEEISADLERTMQFWLKHSHDEQYGGFFNCIGPDGSIYDETKYVWFQGRQVWMYCRLYNEDESFRKPEVLQAAIRGGEFLMKNAKDPKTQKCCLSVTRDGKPIKVQRTIFSETFYVMAMSELARTTKEHKYMDEATSMLDRMIYWVREDGSEVRLGLPVMAGETPTDVLAVPMMLLCLIDQIETMNPGLSERYADLAKRSLEQVLMHIQRDGTVILENVSPTGDELPGSHGRLMVPGHSIEAGWFLLQYATKRHDDALKQTAIEKFILNPFRSGWDADYGGLYYFLDVDGHSPLQLEWNQKLWWTHNEAMIAFLMAYRETRDAAMLEKFAQVFDYCYTKHVDRIHGEWTGYLNRDGSPCLTFKGGPWKGCFHVPRALLMCKQMLLELTKE